VAWVGSLLVLFGVVFGYLQAELSTSFFEDKIGNYRQYCQAENNSDFKGIKVMSYEKHKGEAVIYCLYSDNSKNNRLLLNQVNGVWQVAFQKKLNADGEFYWPVYF
jgi:ribosomal 30S subunit maturation factor RimM